MRPIEEKKTELQRIKEKKYSSSFFMGACAPAVKLRACHALVGFHSEQFGYFFPFHCCITQSLAASKPVHLSGIQSFRPRHMPVLYIPALP